MPWTGGRCGRGCGIPYGKPQDVQPWTVAGLTSISAYWPLALKSRPPPGDPGAPTRWRRSPQRPGQTARVPIIHSGISPYEAMGDSIIFERDYTGLSSTRDDFDHGRIPRGANLPWIAPSGAPISPPHPWAWRYCVEAGAPVAPAPMGRTYQIRTYTIGAEFERS